MLPMEYQSLEEPEEENEWLMDFAAQGEELKSSLKPLLSRIQIT